MGIYDTDIYKGLSSREVTLKKKYFGENEIKDAKEISPVSIFLSQFKDFITLVLIAATLISFILGEMADAIAIFAIVILNGMLGFVQEYRTEKSLQALKKLASPNAKVIRDGKASVISAKDIVPGDIVILESGNRVPADGKILDAQVLKVDESILTGESVPVEKTADYHSEDTNIKIHKKNYAFMGTSVISGRGKMIVTSIGMATEMGKIAGMMESIEDDETPLQKRLDVLGKQLVVLCLILCGLVAFLGVFRGEDVYKMFLIGVSLAVAAIPEGLPAIVTVVLTLGVQRMAKKNVIIRKLPAVETLGCATVICSDKTGTLTENKMSVTRVYANDEIIYVTGSGHKAEGDFISSEGTKMKALPIEVRRMLEIATSCNNAQIKSKKSPGLISNVIGRKELIFDGDPTEVALLVAGLKGDINKEIVDSNYARLKEIPFDSDRKRMSVVVKSRQGELFVFSKGAPDSILPLCNKIDKNGVNHNLTLKDKRRISLVNENMGSKALRVLAFAYKKLNISELEKENLEKNMTFLGMMGMIDPPRPEAIEAVKKCFSSGIRPVMITGDHKTTAGAIARELGILHGKCKVLTGQELDKLSREDFLNIIEEISVFARVTPKHKLRIVKTLKEKGHVVAMTGDGVNDAPAIKEADIGIAMGISGTDVTKEASAMILLDDNFASIVKAIEEGRVIYDNIRKFIRYLLSCNVGEILTMVWASLLGLPVPLLPIQILWVNLVTDGLPAMALGIDPPQENVMLRKPRGQNESIFSRGLGKKIIYRGIYISIATLIVFIITMYYSRGDLTISRTATLSTLVTAQLMFVFECRSENESIWNRNPFSNLYLTVSVIFSFCLLLAVIYIPLLQPIFKTAAIDKKIWLVILALAGLSTVI